ncbi:MAG TPA: hypothetical protein PKA88_00055 [Polyangiaceae bacterium]|nr:hypothetical protein [Polyangiaceae bacterium]
MTRQAAVIFESRDGTFSLPVDTVRRIVTRPPISPVPASELGLSFVHGRVAATAQLGDGPQALLCEHDSDAVTLSGVSVHHVGFFDVEEGQVLWQGKRVPPMDIENCLSACLSRTTSGAAE